jgi:hypothetical protein
MRRVFQAWSQKLDRQKNRQTEQRQVDRQTDTEQKAKEHRRAYDNIKELRRTGRDRTEQTREC